MESIHTLSFNSKAATKSFRLFPNVIGIPKRYEKCGFKNFLIKDENRNAVEDCKNIKEGESISLTGNVGTGKTHIAIATLRNFPEILQNEVDARETKKKIEYYLNVATEIEDKNLYRKILDEEIYKYKKAKCRFIPAPELFLELSESFSGERSKSEILKELTLFDCVCIDDFGAEKLSETNRQNLYLILDRFYREMKSLIITTNMTIDEINSYEPRIASRLAEMGKIYLINGNDFRLI